MSEQSAQLMSGRIAIVTGIAKKRTWLITGGNSGLGYQCARFLCERHPDDVIVITTRDVGRGEAAAAKLRKKRWRNELFARNSRISSSFRQRF
jgi:NAD(P)-dependent dehydrogenase (short-subunit alcohol dehydrogenase family)